VRNGGEQVGEHIKRLNEIDKEFDRLNDERNEQAAAAFPIDSTTIFVRGNGMIKAKILGFLPSFSHKHDPCFLIENLFTGKTYQETLYWLRHRSY
jgi:hypothetical protein